MDKAELQKRTKEFALRVIKMADSMPKTPSAKIITNQIVRSATSVGANYRAACLGRSKAEFYSKLRIVVEEIDECCYWLEIIIESEMLKEKRVVDLLDEASQLTAIFISTSKTMKKNLK